MRVRASRPTSGSGRPTTPGPARAGSSPAPTKGKGVAQAGRGLALHHPLGRRPVGGPDLRRHRCPDLLPGQSGPNLVFHADNAERVYVQSPSLYLTGNGTIVSASSMGAGTIYTVVSRTTPPARTSSAATGSMPRRVRRGTGLSQQTSSGVTSSFLIRTRESQRLPRRSPRTDQPSDAEPHTYDKVEAIELWMSRHIHYTTDIPPLSPGADAVDQLPVRHTARLLRADLDCDRGHVADPSASRHERRWGTCPAPTIRSPISTTSRPRTPTPGYRSGSPGSVGRTSTRPRMCPSPIRRPARS